MKRSAVREVRIGMDAHALTESHTGTGRYASCIARAMAAERPGELALYVQGSGDAAGIPAEERVVPPSPLWTTVGLSLHFARSRAPRAMHYPGHSMPLRPAGGAVVTIHDLGYALFPGHFTPRDRRRLRASTWYSARAADHVITPSDSARADVIERLGVPAERVTRIHHGIDHQLFRPRDPGEVAAVRARHGLQAPYILAVGMLQRRKNHPALIRAMRMVLDRGHDVVLALAGAEGWLYADAKDALRETGLGERVRYLGGISDAELPALYAGAEASAMVSLYEGFGFPVLESLACGTPVLAADNSSFPEVGGDVALYAPAHEPEAIAEGLVRLLADSALRDSIRARAPAHVERFRWDAAARATLSVLDAVADG